MTLKDLRLMLEREQRQLDKTQHLSHELDPTQQLLVKRMANRPFWCGSFVDPNPKRHCWNHLISLPEKNNVAYPIFEWQMNLINDLESGVKYQIMKKSRGAGVTTLYLRYLAWKGVCQNTTYSNKRFALICGPRQALADDLILRLKRILLPLGIVDETTAQVCRFLNVTVEAFPSARVSTLRGYDDLKIAYLDEFGFFGSSKEEQEVRAVCEGYIAKTGLSIICVSTPSHPPTVFEQLMEESDNTCMYKRYRLPYTIALQKPGEPLSWIYSQAEIDQARLSPTFPREYELAASWVGLGNCFLENHIKECIIDYDQPTAQQLSDVVINVGCDSGFATSKTACVVSALLPSLNSMNRTQRATILEAQEFTKVSFSHSKSNFFIISQNKKKKTPEDIEKEEARRELGGRDGISVVDSRESVYGEGGWT
jgi:hypothetical protein